MLKEGHTDVEMVNLVSEMDMMKVILFHRSWGETKICQVQIQIFLCNESIDTSVLMEIHQIMEGEHIQVFNSSSLIYFVKLL